MSNRIALTSLCLFIGLTVFAQNGSKWRIGVKAGVNYTDQLASNFPSSSSVNLNKLYNQGTEWLLGLNAGLHGTLQLSEKVGLNADLLYNQRGFKGITKDSSFQDVNYSSRFHYLSLPLYGSLRLMPRLAFELGAETSYFLNLSGKSGGVRIDGESNNSVTKVDFGLIAGLSFELTDRLSLQGRYYRGLKDVFDVTFTDVNGAELDINPRFTNHGVQLSLTVFPF